MKTSIHVSDVRTFWKCKMQWGFTSPLRRNLEPDRIYAPFLTGRAVHFGLEQYYKGVDVTKALDAFFAAEKAKLEASGGMDDLVFGEQVDLTTGLIQHYLQWVKNQHTMWSDDQFDFLKWEHEWHLPLLTPAGRISPRIVLGGRFDGLIRRKDDKSLWLWETKTARSIDELGSTLWNDLQATVYCDAARRLYNEPIAGVLYNVMRKKLPTEPEVLKSGYLTMRANIDTTPEAYAAAVKAHHKEVTLEIRAHYEEFLYNLSRTQTPFFARIPIRRTKEQLDRAMTNMYYVCLEMAHPQTAVFPMPAWSSCRFCMFQDPCKAWSENRLDMMERILTDEYRVKQPYSDLEVEIES